MAFTTVFSQIHPASVDRFIFYAPHILEVCHSLDNIFPSPPLFGYALSCCFILSRLFHVVTATTELSTFQYINFALILTKLFPSKKNLSCWTLKTMQNKCCHLNTLIIEKKRSSIFQPGFWRTPGIHIKTFRGSHNFCLLNSLHLLTSDKRCSLV